MRHRIGRRRASAGALGVAPLLAALAFPQGAAARDPQVPVSVQQLSADADSPEAKVRRSAVRALAESAQPEALGPLGRLVGDPLNDIQGDAINGVIRIYVTPDKGQVGGAEEAFDLAPYRATPWPAPPELVANLTRALGDDWPAVRRDAAYAIAVILQPPADERTAWELMQSMGDREPGVRKAAARAIGRLRIRSASVALIGGVNDVDLDVRLASMRALGDVRETLAVKALTDQFEFYRKGIAGRAALDALARIGDPASTALFEEQSASGNPAHRQSAFEGLGRIGLTPGAIGRIESTLSGEKDSRVSTAMAFALAASGRPYTTQVVDALANKRVAAQALEYLVEIGPKSAAEIAGASNHADVGAREGVAIALGFIGGPEAQAALGRLEGDADPNVQRAAKIALARLRTNERPAT